MSGVAAYPLIVSTAAFNGLGMNSHQSWAFWRAELSPWSESPFVCANGERATLAFARTLPLRSLGAERLLALAHESWPELLPALRAMPEGARIGFFLGISERFGPLAVEPFIAQRRVLENGLRTLVEATCGAQFALFPNGHAAFAYALREALAALGSHKLDVAVVGGLDSHYDTPVADALVAQERLFDQENTEAIIPGEGAAFLLLTRREVQRQARFKSLAQVEISATGLEEATLLGDLPCAARGLSDAMRAVTTRLKAQRRQVEWLLMDVTNEPYRTHEFGLAVPRAMAPGGLDAGRDYFEVASADLTYDFLPENFGDLGAATMATAAVLAAQTFHRGVPRARNCMVTGSSVTKERGAVFLSAP